MGFPQAIERLQQAVFDRLGEPAAWEGVVDPVRVRRPRDGDQQFRTDYSELIVDAAVMAVRVAQVAEPVEGQQVQVHDDDGNDLADGLFVVSGTPRLDRKKGVWICQVKPAVAP